MISYLHRVVDFVGARTFPQSFKRRSELRYWKERKAEEFTLSNTHYAPLYTTAFGLTRADYTGMRVLDIGCGPRGSLEWADMAIERVGLDPLIPEYLKLGADKHRMSYAASPSEAIPFPDGHFDIVTCLNALDHVDDISKTISEIKRVTKHRGLFLLSVEIDHEPTPNEPITITNETLALLKPEFEVLSERHVGTPQDHNLHAAVMSGKPVYVRGDPGIYVARMRRA